VLEYSGMAIQKIKVFMNYLAKKTIHELHSLFMKILAAVRSIRPAATDSWEITVNSSANKQSNLVSPWLIVVVTVIIIVMLIFLFPKREVLEQVKQQQSVDVMVRSYVNSLIKLYPDNTALKLIRADQYIQLGKLSEALKEVMPFVITRPVTPTDWQALWLYYKIIRSQTYALPDTGNARLAGLTKMQSMFDKFYQHFISGPELMMLATDASYLYRPKAALELYRRIINSTISYTAVTYALIAKFALGEGDYKLSADAYFIAKHLAPNINDKRKYFILGLKSLQSGNLLALAQMHIQENFDLVIINASSDASSSRGAVGGAQASMNSVISPEKANKYQAQRAASRGDNSGLSQSNGARQVAIEDQAIIRELYLLISDILLAVNDIKGAYKITELAVKNWPDNLVWRKKLAIIAAWDQKPEIALEQWLFIANHSLKDQDLLAADQGIKLAHMLRNYFILSELSRIKLKYLKNDESAWNSYIEAEEGLGNPQTLISALETVNKIEAKLFYYEKLASLYLRTGNAKAELATLDLIASKFGTNTQLALRQAEILYSNKDIIAAQQKLVRATKIAESKNFEFWQTLGLLSWLVQDFKNAKLAYEKLHHMGKIDQYELMNFIQVINATETQTIFTLALEGWHKYKMEFFLVKILELAPALNEWSKLAIVLAEIPKDIKLRIENNMLYYAARAKLLLQSNQGQQALMVYEQALQKLPTSVDLKIDCLWFLIDNQYNNALKEKLIAWEGMVFVNINFSTAYAAGCVLLNDPGTALKIYRQQFLQKQHDAPWLINLASVLEQLNMLSEAALVRRLAWLELLQSTQNITNKEFANNLLTLALSFNDLELANYMYNFYGVNQDTDPWIRQTLALSNNDLGLLDELLAEKLDQLPYRDRVVAASRTGNKNLAQTLAFNGLKDHPQDSDMYSLFTDTMLPASDDFDTETMFVKNGYINGIQEKFSSTLFITPRTSIIPWASVWRTTSVNTDQILAATNYDSSTGMKLAYQHKHGVAAVDFGVRHSLANFVMLKLANSYLVTSKLNLTLGLGYRQLADETSALLIAGMKNEAKIGATYQLTVRDSLSGNFSYKNFNSQDGVFLGKGQVLDINYNHKFEFGYPDWNASLFSSVNSYQATGSVSSQARQIIPALQTTTTRFFVSEGYVRFGAGLGVGQGYRDNYTHAWRPFADISVFEDLGAGLGNYMDIGIAGSVFGRDHLMLYYQRSVGYAVAGQINYTYGMRYKLYF